mmetsp:Transcript_72017/g.204397  ORF Transcript_72017/g.204397 Transcript_72017/m.204397 type:complete len:306 (-) Transcript_72017:160-1077(-)
MSSATQRQPSAVRRFQPQSLPVSLTTSRVTSRATSLERCRLTPLPRWPPRPLRQRSPPAAASSRQVPPLLPLQPPPAVMHHPCPPSSGSCGPRLGAGSTRCQHSCPLHSRHLQSGPQPVARRSRPRTCCRSRPHARPGWRFRAYASSRHRRLCMQSSTAMGHLRRLLRRSRWPWLYHWRGSSGRGCPPLPPGPTSCPSCPPPRSRAPTRCWTSARACCRWRSSSRQPRRQAHRWPLRPDAARRTPRPVRVLQDRPAHSVAMSLGASRSAANAVSLRRGVALFFEGLFAAGNSTAGHHVAACALRT